MGRLKPALRRSALIATVLVACTNPEQASPSRIVRDDLNREVRLPAQVGRVVTLAPNLTEIIFAIGSGAKIAGTDDFSDTPDAAKSIPKVGGMQPNVEKIVALKPDLVIATTN